MTELHLLMWTSCRTRLGLRSSAHLNPCTCHLSVCHVTCTANEAWWTEWWTPAILHRISERHWISSGRSRRSCLISNTPAAASLSGVALVKSPTMLLSFLSVRQSLYEPPLPLLLMEEFVWMILKLNTLPTWSTSSWSFSLIEWEYWGKKAHEKIWICCRCWSLYEILMLVM